MPMMRVNGTRLWVEQTGSGPPLVLIHGLGSSGLDWEPQVAGYSDRFTVLTIDLRGHGRSERAGGDYSIRLFAADVASVMEQLKLGAAHVCGISLGGAIAFQLAVDRPDLVRSLVIVNSGPYMILEKLSHRLIIWSRFAVIRLFGLPKLGELVAKKLFPKPEHERVRNAFIERFRRNDQVCYVKSLRSLIGWSVKDRLGDVRVPVLVVSADQDYTPVSMKEEYLPLIPNARLVVIPHSHHAVTMECPEAFNRELAAFLDQS